MASAPTAVTRISWRRWRMRSKPTWAASPIRSRPTPAIARTPISRRWRAAISTPISRRAAPNTPRKDNAEARASPPCARKSRPEDTHPPHARENQGRRTRTPLSAAQATARAGVRPDQAGSRLPSVPDARARQRRPRMGPRLPRPQHAQARPRPEFAPRQPRHRLNPAKPPKPDAKPADNLKHRYPPHYLDRLLEHRTFI